MSYLIQNVHQSQPSIRVNLRVRTGFVARNAHVIYTLLNSAVTLSLLRDFRNSYILRNLLYFRRLFSRFTTVVLPLTKFVKYVPMGVNFPSSAQYRAIAIIHNLLRGVKSSTTLSSIPKLRFKYPYFTPHRIALTPVAGLSFFTALYKLLRVTLNLWCV